MAPRVTLNHHGGACAAVTQPEFRPVEPPDATLPLSLTLLEVRELLAEGPDDEALQRELEGAYAERDQAMSHAEEQRERCGKLQTLMQQREAEVEEQRQLREEMEKEVEQVEETLRAEVEKEQRARLETEAAAKLALEGTRKHVESNNEQRKALTSELEVS